MAVSPIVPCCARDSQHVLHFAQCPFSSPLVAVCCVFVSASLRAVCACRRPAVGALRGGECCHA